MSPPSSPQQSWSNEQLQSREWLVTNGLGGYAAGTVGGLPSRRYHGLLVAALPAPLGRTLLLAQLSERLRLADGATVQLGGEGIVAAGRRAQRSATLIDFT